MKALKLAHGIAMAGLLKDQGQGDKAMRIENKYAPDFTSIFHPKTKTKAGPCHQPTETTTSCQQTKPIATTTILKERERHPEDNQDTSLTATS